MSIPLDRLYPYIEYLAMQNANGPVELRRFYPHGSKDISNLLPLTVHAHGYTKYISPMIFCNDQEPLDFDRYQDIQLASDRFKALVNKYQLKKSNFEFQRHNIYDKSLLVHSEQRSANLEKYQNNQFIPVYYWSHAVISLDWFRFAQYVSQQKQINKTFLIYNRAWAGTREYRLKFADLLIKSNLVDCCHTTVNAVDPETQVHYNNHQFRNESWRPTHTLENYFDANTSFSHYSADFDIADYQSTDIEVVLETLFDDNRLHLTEKSLRPIACSQPFILAGTHGSLEYLRSYGFKTFGTVWDESYDLENNPEQRLKMIIDVMKQISTWRPDVKKEKMIQARAIAQHNRRHFFSTVFFDQVISELKTNLKNALEELENTNTSSIWIERRKKLWNIPEFQEIWHDNGPDSYYPGRTRQDTLKIVSKARYYYNRSRPSARSTDV